MAYDTAKSKKAKDKVTAEEALECFRTSYAYWNPIYKKVEEDFEFALGKQWEDKDIQTLRTAGVDALTINKILPMVNLLSGIERQGRTDMIAFPEGAEDTLDAEIATRLLKNLVKQSYADHKMSEQFEDGVIGGMGYIEFFPDYTYDLLNGEMKSRKISCFECFPDPDSVEYDFSDGAYFCRFQQDLKKEQLLTMFPDREKDIENLAKGKVNFEKFMPSSDQHVQGEDYPELSEAGVDQFYEDQRGCYDVLFYFYKKTKTVHMVGDIRQGTITECKSKEEAEAYVEEHGKDPETGEEVAKAISKRIPEIWRAVIVGGEVFEDEVAWTYPRWKGFPFIPFFANRTTTPIKDKSLMYQGIVRPLKGVQRELNKRRTQSLRHLNSTANSGYFVPKKGLDRANKNKLIKFGSSPGVYIEYDPEIGKPEKIQPTQLSQGHEQLALENTQDLREIAGINAELLVAGDGQDSGRAILLRQKQGLVMIQRILDNYSRTKKVVGRFLLTQLGEVYTVETAVRVCGDSFITENFSVPIDQVLTKESQKKAQDPNYEVKPEIQRMAALYPTASPQTPAVDPQGELVKLVDWDQVGEVFNRVLNDAEIGKYDVSVGEGPYSETIKMANYLLLTDLVEKGIPIPPDVLIQESSLNEGAKAKIAQAIERAQKAAMAAPQPAPAKK